ncbi:MAG: aldose 1-epimerase family protein, partial [Micrococcales bacterium]|nr:aldose 1-epimerase family protein [Micrococcales bacterium]
MSGDWVKAGDPNDAEGASAADSCSDQRTGPSGLEWAIRHTGSDGRAHEARIVAVGATLRRYDVDSAPVIRGFAADQMCPDYRGKQLMPWPNRVGDGCYRLDDVEYRLALTEPERGNALHGLLCWQTWAATERTESSVTCETVLYPQPGWAWTLRCRVTYALDDEGLRITPWVRNESPQTAPAAPFGYSAHPYVTAGEERVDDVEVTLPAQERLRVDPERLLPLASSLAESVAPVEGEAVLTGGLLGERDLDLAYTSMRADADGRWRAVVRHPATGRSSTLWAPADAYPWAQIFTGGALPEPVRRRSGIALEPMTCGPDALRTGEGLIMLSTGQEWSAPWGLSSSPPS